MPDVLYDTAKRAARDAVLQVIADLAEVSKSRMLSFPHAAAYLDISPKTLEEYVGAGELVPVRYGTGPKAPRYFERADLDAFVERRKSAA